VDSDTGIQQSLAATADNESAAGGAGGALTIGTCSAPGNDEDGVEFPELLVVGQSSNVSITASAGTEACQLNAWIDYNADGDFTDSGEQIASDLAIAAGSTESLAVAVPANALPGMTYARFRCDSDGGLSPVGAAADGEVEDYRVELFTPGFFSIQVESICIQDAPYLDYSVETVGLIDPSLSIRWLANDGSGDVEEALTDQSLSGRLLWPGAEVDAEGNGIAWPGWEQDANGRWYQVPTRVRPETVIEFQVNPTEVRTVSYPPATASCRTGPFIPPPTPVPAGNPWLTLLMVLMLGGAGYRGLRVYGQRSV
jgi:hypothetical protein